jgi:hypothetical protein
VDAAATPLQLSARVQTVDFVGRTMLRQFLQMTPDAITGEMNVAVEGEWMGHPSGPFSMDAEKMQQCVRRFEQQANPMLVDYEHNSVAGGDGRAAGWIQKLYVKQLDDRAELWATVEWTATAANMIKGGEYRYCSPVIDFGGKDRATGEHVAIELFNVAITNNPFLDGMHPIALSRVAAAFEPADEGDKKSTPPEAEADEDDETEGDEDGAAAEDGEQADPLPPEPPGAQQGVSTEAALNAFVERCMETSGGSKAAVLAGLSEMADEVGSRLRDRLDNKDGGAADAREIPMTDTKKPEDQTASDDDQNVGMRELVIAMTRELRAVRAEREEDKRIAAERDAKRATDEKAQI